MDKRKEPMDVLSFRITKEQHELLTREARRRTVGKGAVIRWALDLYFSDKETAEK